MKLFSILLLIFFLHGIFGNDAKSMESTPDSLIYQYNNSNSDSTQVFTLREIVNFWKVRDCDSTIYYSKILANEAKQLGHDVFYYKGIYWLINCYGSIGLYDSALQYGFKGINHFKFDTVSFQKTILHIMVGEQFRAMAMFEEALFYLNEAWKYSQEINKPHVKYTVSNRLAAVHYENKNSAEALYWINVSMKIGDEIESIDYYLSNLNIQGSIYRDQQNYNKALITYLKALDFAETNSDSIRICEIHNNIANAYRNMGMPENTIKFAQPSYNYTSAKDIRALSVVSAEVLSYAYAQTGDYRNAYEYSRSYEILKDELFFEERDKQISELNTKYETEEKESQIKIQKISLEKKDLAIKQKNILSWFFVSVLFLLLLFLGFRHWAHQKLIKVNDELSEKNELVIQQKKELETASKEIEQAYNKLKELDEFKQSTTRMLVHDLKNPLNLLTNIDILEDDAERISVVKQSSGQMLNLVMNMLDISKAENNTLILDKTNINLFDTIEEAIKEVDFLTKPKNTSIINNISEEYRISADRELTKRVFCNLLTNAIKHSPRNGMIRIGINITKGKLQLSFSDEGPGIAQEFHEAIFEQFTQVSNQNIEKGSTGLGLAFCKLAVEAHGWNIWLESVIGNGANFIIEIPDYEHNYENVTRPAKKTINSEGSSLFIELSKEKRTTLNSYICELKNLPINAISEIKTNLKNIRELNDEKLNDWASHVLKAVEAFDEEKYLTLIKSLSDEQL